MKADNVKTILDVFVKKQGRDKTTPVVRTSSGVIKVSDLYELLNATQCPQDVGSEPAVTEVTNELQQAKEVLREIEEIVKLNAYSDDDQLRSQLQDLLENCPLDWDEEQK